MLEEGKVSREREADNSERVRECRKIFCKDVEIGFSNGSRLLTKIKIIRMQKIKRLKDLAMTLIRFT